MEGCRPRVGEGSNVPNPLLEGPRLRDLAENAGVLDQVPVHLDLNPTFTYQNLLFCRVLLRLIIDFGSLGFIR